jgi:hypothetical protein
MLLEFSTVLLVVATSLASACRIAAAKYSSTVLQVHVVPLLVLLSKTGTSTTSTVLTCSTISYLYSESTEPKIRLILKMYSSTSTSTCCSYLYKDRIQNKEVLYWSAVVESSQSSASAQLFDRTTSIESESPK